MTAIQRCGISITGFTAPKDDRQECGAEYRDADGRCTAGSTKVERARMNFRRNRRVTCASSGDCRHQMKVAVLVK
jgi:hypothetical protein